MGGKKFKFLKRKDPEEESLIGKSKEEKTSSGFDEIQSDQNSEFDKVKAGGSNKNKYSSSKPNAVKKMIINKYHKLQNIISTVGVHGDKDEEQVALLLQRPSQETEGFAEFQSYENSEFSKMKAGGSNKNQSSSKANAVKMITNKYHKLQNWIRTVGKENEEVAFLLERPPEETEIKNIDENAVRVRANERDRQASTVIASGRPELVAVAETPIRPVVTDNEITINHPEQQVAAKTETVVTSAATCVDNRIRHLEQEVEALTEVLMSIENALATCSKLSEPKVAGKQGNPGNPLIPSSNSDKNCQKTHSEPASTPRAQEHLYNLRCMFTRNFSPLVQGYQQWRVEQHQ